MNKNTKKRGVKREKASQKQKERIVRATERLLLSRGCFHSISTSHICNAASISRPTFYHYFQNKTNALLTVQARAIDVHLSAYTREALLFDDPLERLVYMVRTLTRMICLNPELRILIHDHSIMKDKRFREIKARAKSIMVFSLRR
jgi:AcrR family transcriptional regulator